MITGLYSAASGMLAQVEYQDVIAHNLANANVTGFRKQRMVFRSFPDILLRQIQGPPPQTPDIGPANSENRRQLLTSKVGTGAGIDWAYVDFSRGQLHPTGNPNHLALAGDGFFSVDTPAGVRYTRSGEFYVDPVDGVLKTTDGHFPVLDADGGPVAVGDEPFSIGRDGTILQNGVSIGQLAVVDFRNRNLLAPEGASLLRFDGPNLEEELAAPEILHVQQGALEGGNANPLLEMIYLTDSYRNFEACQRVVAAIDRTLERVIVDVGQL